MADYIFLREHYSDGERIISLNYVSEIRKSPDNHHAEVFYTVTNEWIRVNVLYNNLKNIIKIP